MGETASPRGKPRAGLPKGLGLWRFPNFFKSLSIDAPQWGLVTASQLHFRRLTMEWGARQLPPVAERSGGEPLMVHFMSGREHWAMTAFCAYSLLESTRTNLVPVVLDDGSLDEAKRDELRRILRNVRFLEARAAAEKVETALDRDRFPALHRMRSELPLMKKLLDLHAGESGWKLFLDSDMLFFREPQWMLEWLRGATHPVYMWDFQDSYGYTRETIERVLGAKMPKMINTGFCGLRSDAIDWDLLERWAAKLHEAGGTNHFSEQCLAAMWMSVSNAMAAPREYLIWPPEEESREPSAVMHHYVAESRTWYYIFGWPGILGRKHTT